MFEQLKGILVSELKIDETEITLETSLTEDLGLNSLELADLVLVCEDTFKVSVPDEDIRGFITIGDVVKYMEENTK